MSTKACLFIYDEDNNLIVQMNKRTDGQHYCFGADLADILNSTKIINGITANDNIENAANGMGCLAAKIISKFKTRVGDTYLYYKKEFSRFDYVYFLRKDCVVIINDFDLLFVGDYQSFYKFCKGPYEANTN